MKKSIITLVVLLLTIGGIEAGKGGGIAGGLFGYSLGYTVTRAAESGNRGRGSSYYERKIHSKERRNKRAQEGLEEDKEKLKELKQKLRKAKRRNQ